VEADCSTERCTSSTVIGDPLGAGVGCGESLGEGVCVAAAALRARSGSSDARVSRSGAVIRGRG
jgi:hypothetical protein